MRFPVLLAALLFVAACGEEKTYESTLDKVLDQKVLIVGTEPAFPPFETKNEKGEFVGFDMDMVRLLATELGVELRLEEMEFASLIPALKTGKIDLIASGMTAKPERAKSVTFTDPYFHTALCLLVNKESGLKSAADVKKHKITVKQGTTGQDNVPILFPEAEMMVMQTETDCSNEVAFGRADAFLYDQLSILKAHEKHKETTLALLEPLKKQPYAMAVRLGDERFVERVNEFLVVIRADGRYQALRDKYLAGIPDETD
jgi:polar amino acid transport system substrate-binding protein